MQSGESSTRLRGVASYASPRSLEAHLVPDVYPLICWPLGIAVGGGLFFKIAKRM
jgi:hypothetical protein